MTVAQRILPACQSAAYQVALAALEAGVSVLPIRPDGTKQPALPGWKRYQQEMPTEALVEEWFRNPQRGLALVTGHISGGLVALDFDDLVTFDAWLRHIQSEQALHALYEAVGLGDLVLLPRVMLDNEGARFLDDLTVEAFHEQLPPGVRAGFVRNAQETVTAISSLAAPVKPVNGSARKVLPVR